MKNSIMLVIYGLGNHDPKYLQTKHNIGRVVAEFVANKLGLSFQKKDNFAFTKITVNDQIVYFVYSLGYMNHSGEPLLSFSKYFKIDFSNTPSALLVLQDDSDQIESKAKLVSGGGSAGHHGINSVYKHIPKINLPMSNLWRLKIGIRPQDNRLKSETFVLNSLSSADLVTAEKLALELHSNLDQLTETKFEKLQMKLNTSLTLA